MYYGYHVLLSTCNRKHSIVFPLVFSIEDKMEEEQNGFDYKGWCSGFLLLSEELCVNVAV